MIQAVNLQQAGRLQRSDESDTEPDLIRLGRNLIEAEGNYDEMFLMERVCGQNLKRVTPLKKINKMSDTKGYYFT